MGVGIGSWKWEGMGSKKSFPHISTTKAYTLAPKLKYEVFICNKTQYKK